MFQAVRTLIAGANAQANEHLTDRFAIDLLTQKIREAEDMLTNAKQTLASIIVRERTERSNLDAISGQIADLERRATSALKAGSDGLVVDAAAAIASLENERNLRTKTVAGLAERAQRMRVSIEKMHRRIIDLRQGAIQARAIDAEHKAQRSLNRTIGSSTSVREAEELLARILGRDDPLVETSVLDEIDEELGHSRIVDRLADAGFGAPLKIRADDVLLRLRATPTVNSTES